MLGPSTAWNHAPIWRPCRQLFRTMPYWLGGGTRPAGGGNPQGSQEFYVLVTQHECLGLTRLCRRHFYQRSVDREQGTHAGALQRRHGCGDVTGFEYGFVDGLPKGFEQSFYILGHFNSPSVRNSAIFHGVVESISCAILRNRSGSL